MRWQTISYFCKYMLPQLGNHTIKDSSGEILIADKLYIQNMHSYLAIYKQDLVLEHILYDDFSPLVSDDIEIGLLHYLTDFGFVNSSQQCENCGGTMRNLKQGNVWDWICTKQANSIKCNNCKFNAIITNCQLKGNFFRLRIVWNFIHHLSIFHCDNFCNAGKKTDHTPGKYTLIVEMRVLHGSGTLSIHPN